MSLISRQLALRMNAALRQGDPNAKSLSIFRKQKYSPYLISEKVRLNKGKVSI